MLKGSLPKNREVETPDNAVIAAFDRPFAEIAKPPRMLEMNVDVIERRRPENRRQREFLQKLISERTAQLLAANEQLEADIAKRERVEEALRESEEKYRGLFSMMQEAFFIADIMTDESGKPVDFRVVEANRALELQIDFPLEQIVGNTAQSLGLNLLSQGIEIYGHVAMTGEPVRFETFVPQHARHYEGMAYQVHAGRFAALFVDVTERKRTQDALVKTEKLASIGRMAASIAHEINNPLEAVANTIFLARLNATDSQAVHKYLDMADDELKRIAHITRQTLGFYRENSSPKDVSVSSVLDSAVEVLQGKIKATHTHIEKQYDDSFHVQAIPGELRQVFANLLVNSMEAGVDGGGIVLRIAQSTCLTNHQPRIKITVADRGQGIESNNMPRIFEPLFTTKVSTGTGLGLWVARQIVEKHGGIIRVRSRSKGDNRGTVFQVYLPAVTVSEAAGN
jgi:C4-dicarboxylate-specific signal transduction histidine kinase